MFLLEILQTRFILRLVACLERPLPLELSDLSVLKSKNIQNLFCIENLKKHNT